VSNAFCRFELRTTDPDAARSFYDRLLGPELWGHDIEVGTLPPQAVARGAVPHWLGHIAVENVDTTVERFVTRGATPLGPRSGVPCILRDPFGVIVALTQGRWAETRNSRVPWQMLHVSDETQAFAVYADIFGWKPLRTFDIEGAPRGVQAFTWNQTTRPAGSVANTASSPGVHPHWMFFFRCEALENSLAIVREFGGLTLPAIKQPDGSRVAACEDPQGAAFGLYQASGRTEVGPRA